MAEAKLYRFKTVIGCTLLGLLAGLSARFPIPLGRAPETNIHSRTTTFVADPETADRVGMEQRHAIVKAVDSVTPGTPLILRAELVRLPKP